MNNNKLSSSDNQFIKIGILWFRNDLRVHDNLVLNYAIDLINKKKLDKILPIYCYDKDLHDGKSRLAKLPRCGIHRQNFIIQCVDSLEQNMKKRLNSALFKLYGIPEFEIIKLIEAIMNNNNSNLVRIETVIASREINSEEINMENRLKNMLNEKKISLKLVWDATMIHIDDLGFDLLQVPNFSMALLVKSTIVKEGSSDYNVRKPVDVPKDYSMPTFDVTNIVKSDLMNSTPSLINTNKFQFSAIEGMNGGEQNALNRLHHFIFESDGIKRYKHTRKGLIGKDYSSKLSLWLAYGCIGLRFIYSKIKYYEQNFASANESTRHFTYELLIRDLFRFYSYKYREKIFYLNGINSKVYDPETQTSYFISNYVWKQDKDLFDKWCRGETGYPFVDANMKELNETGYMSNRGRINVASFLTRDLGIDWRFGAEYFETQLIDYDCGINWGMWKWAANVNGDNPEEHHFNVVKQGYDHDCNGDYVKMWLTKLVNVPKELIHCPYRMGLVDQKRYKCTIGQDYPAPIIRLEHEWKQNQIDKAVPKNKPRKSDFDNYLDFENY